MDIDISALKGLTRERGLSLDYVVDAIEQALLVAYLHSTGAHESARVELDRTNGHVVVIADELDDDGNKIGEFEATPAGFGRVAASLARGVITQRLKAADDDATVAEFQAKEGDHLQPRRAQAARHARVGLRSPEPSLFHRRRAGR